ncbi:MAG: AHH domain-containing protein [Ginsengibacter sp.]
MAKKAKARKRKTKCTFCDKEIHNIDIGKAGTNIGNSDSLGNAVMKLYGGKPIRRHPLSMLKGRGYGAQAHHIICSESMDEPDWGRVCKNFGYNINHKNNGIILPADLRMACQEHVPLHKGNHSGTVTDIGKLNYVDAVMKKISPVLKKALTKKYCDKPENIITRLNNISKSIWSKLKGFRWTITYDGKHYNGRSKKGCMGVKGLKKKQALDASEECPAPGRNHGINIRGTYWEEQS